MEVTFGLYFRGRSLGDITETLRIHSVPKQQCRGSGNLMWHISYAE
jgi:hypothetical protein